MNSNVIIACDFQSDQDLFTFLNHFQTEKLFLKLGMELIFSCGFNIIYKLVARGHKIFLDLKLHDITNTMVRTVKVLLTYPITMMTIHLAAGAKTVTALQKLCQNQKIMLLGVTVLTNLDNNDIATLYPTSKLSIVQLVLNFAAIAANSKIAGIICAVGESALVKAKYPQLITVCPGINWANQTNYDDQKRSASPQFARKMAADYLVVGRAITQSDDPYRVYCQIKQLFNQGERND